MAMTEENKARLAEIALIKKAETAAMRAEEKRLAELDPHKTCKNCELSCKQHNFVLSVSCPKKKVTKKK